MTFALLLNYSRKLTYEENCYFPIIQFSNISTNVFLFVQKKELTMSQVVPEWIDP